MEQLERRVANFQKEFLSKDNPFVAIIGAKGSGKTYVGALFVLSMLQRGGQGLVMFNTFQQAKDIYKQNIKTMLDELGWPYHFNEQQMILTVWDNTVHFRSAESDVIRRIESIEYEWGWADESSYFKPDSLNVFASRIRKGLALKRITSMPADPDAYIYNFIERRDDAKLFEISLQDNPDPVFRERYTKELMNTYSGAQLERYLYGKRVSLEGIGLFYITPDMRGQYKYDPKDTLVLSWDFNVEYRAVSGWQVVGRDEAGRPKVACVFAKQMKEATVGDDAEKLANELRNHKSDIVITGDATGANRTALATGSMWTAIKEKFHDVFGGTIRYRVPDTNPLVRDTIECCNWSLKNKLVYFDTDDARDVYNSMVAAKADKYGDIDKKDDYKEGAVKSHDADTARYALWHFYMQMYPGNNKNYWIV